jgi:hypothetical protein
MKQFFQSRMKAGRWIFAALCVLCLFIVGISAVDSALNLGLGYQKKDVSAAIIVLGLGLLIFFITFGVIKLVEIVTQRK